MPQIRRIDIPQLVKVRKHEVDCERLRNLLREHKKRSGKSNKALADALDVPVTKVEHWFRTDSCFAIPDAEIWEQLKAELSITTTEFDDPITVFEERPGVYEKSERCYFAEGIAPTLTSTSAGNEKIIVEENSVGKTVAAAMRGRYDKDGCVQQVVEVSDREYANALTTVQKDSLAAEILTTSPQQCTAKPVCLNSKGGRGGIEGLQPSIQDRVYDSNAIATAVTTSFSFMPSYTDRLRIRKLTPKECFRLMGFSDADYEKASAVNSNTQLYKQAGNSIGVPVVQHIFTALFYSGILHK